MEKLAQIDIGEQFKLNSKGVESLGNIGDIITAILPNVYILAGVILIFLLIGGGVMVIVGAGQESPERVGQGRKAITAALAGFFIIFASYWIMQIIRIVTGIDMLGF